MICTACVVRRRSFDKIDEELGNMKESRKQKDQDDLTYLKKEGNKKSTPNNWRSDDAQRESRSVSRR